jgi:hypothetical protein
VGCYTEETRAHAVRHRVEKVPAFRPTFPPPKYQTTKQHLPLKSPAKWAFLTTCRKTVLFVAFETILGKALVIARFFGLANSAQKDHIGH